MKTIFTLLLLLLCSLSPFSQTIYYVKPTGSDANDGTSWATAFKTLQKAINTINTGELWVAAGTYYPDEGPYQTDNNRNSYFTLKNNVALYGGFAGNEAYFSERRPATNHTILSGEIQQDGQMDNNSFHVVRSANVTATAVLDGFTITRGRANSSFPMEDERGAGMHNYYSSPTISNCLFVSNSAWTFGGAICNDHASPTLTNCSFWGNTAAFRRYTDNWDGWGAAMYNTSSAPNLINCSFFANQAAVGAAIDGELSSLSLVNCILWNNGREIVNFGGSITVSYSLVRGGFPGTGNISSDPLFVNADAGNLRLQGCSPAIDGGRIAALPSTVTGDADGNPRFVPGEVDMGAYEYQPGGAATVIFVNRTVSGGLLNGTSWANAFNNLPEALQKAATCRGSEIWVTAGTYYPTETGSDRFTSFMLKNNVTLRGGFRGTELPDDSLIKRDFFTTLSGDIDKDGSPSGNSYHVVQTFLLDNTAVLDGFIITGGNADGDANLKNDRGGGLFNEQSYPTIQNCIFINNRAKMYGGGTYNSNSDYSPTLTNCLFTRDSSGYAGGAIYNVASSPRIVNCTIAANFAADKGGGVCNSGAYPVITNCILWANSSSIDNVFGGAPMVSYSLVQDGYSGPNNLTGDPLFVDESIGDFRLGLGSPAINAGNDAVVPASVTQDLDNFPRFQGTHVDMGAYEFAIAVSPQPLNLTCPENFIVENNANSCGVVADFTGGHAATTNGGAAPIIVTYAPASGELLPVGVNAITVTATDSEGSTKTCSFIITVVDNTPPVITGVSATPSVLHPPNHKMRDIELAYTATDNCGAITTSISVTSNEPEYGSGDTGPDWLVVNDHKVKLRSERSGNGNDRIYTITLIASDASGNTDTATTMVTVPHDKGQVSTAPGGNFNEPGSLVVKVVPNPSSESFTLYTQTPSTLPLSIRVMDGAGRVVESRKGDVANGTIYFGNNYRPGVYYLQVMQGNVQQTIKLVKQNR